MSYLATRTTRKYLKRLLDRLVRQKHRAKSLCDKTSARAKTKPKAFARMRKFLRQVALFRHREDQLLSQIDRIEREHRYMRTQRRLRKAQFDRRLAIQKRQRQSRERFWLFLLLLWLILQSARKNPFALFSASPR